MEDFSNADVSVSAARSVLILNGEYEAAEELRGMEVFSRQSAELAAGVLRGIHPRTDEGRHACATALDILVRSVRRDRRAVAA